MVPPNQLQRSRPSRRGTNRAPSRAGSLSQSLGQMRRRHVLMLAAVFCIQGALNIGYFGCHELKNAFGYASIVIPLVGYVTVLYRLPAFQNRPVAVRAILAIVISGAIWFVGGWAIMIPLVWSGLAKPTF